MQIKGGTMNMFTGKCIEAAYKTCSSLNAECEDVGQLISGVMMRLISLYDPSYNSFIGLDITIGIVPTINASQHL